MFSKSGWSYVSACVVGLSAAGAFGQTFVDLGPGSSTGMSSDGAVVAFNNSPTGYIWTQQYGAISLGAATTAGVAMKGASVLVGGNIGGNAQRWDGDTQGNGTWTQLPLTGGTTAWIALCTSANAAGTDAWVGGNTSEAAGSRKAIRWKLSSNSSTALQLPPSGNNDSYILGVSDTGAYAGRAQYGAVSPSGSRQAMGTGTLKWLGTLVGAASTSNESIANAIARDASAIGGWSKYPSGLSGYRQACVWTNLSGTPTVTGVPFLGVDDYSEVQPLNGNGTVAGGYSYDENGPTGDGPRHVFIWDAVNGSRDLAVVLAAAGVDLTGWVLTDIKGMSADGKWVTGNGTFNSVAHAWVASVPDPCAIPFADADRDDDVDQVDYGIFQACYTGTVVGVPAACACFDRVKDQMVNADDLTQFVKCVTGPTIPFDINNPPIGCTPGNGQLP